MASNTAQQLVRFTKPTTTKRGMTMANPAPKMQRIPLSDVHVPKGWNARSGDWTKFVDPTTGENWEQFCGTFMGNDGKPGLNKTPVEVRQGSNKLPYDLVAGFRRYAALKHIGAKDILVVIEEMDDYEARMRNIEENANRQDLKGADLAWALGEARTLSGGKAGGTELAKRISRSQAYIDRLLKIASSVDPEIFKEWRLSSHIIGVDAMYKVAELPLEKQRARFDKIVQGNTERNETAVRGAGAWIETYKKQAHALGVILGKLSLAELIDIGEDSDWEAVLKMALKIPAKAKATNFKSAAKQVEKGYAEGLEPEEDEEGGDEESEEK